MNNRNRNFKIIQKKQSNHINSSVNKKTNKGINKNIKSNKKNKKTGAVKNTAPTRNKQINNAFDGEIIIGIDNNQINYNHKKNNSLVKSKNSKMQRVKKTKKLKRVKKLSNKQIKKRQAIVKLVKWTSLFLIIIGILIYVMLSPLFAIKKITVTTDGKLTEQEVVSLSAINLNENTFKFTKKQITENIKENSYVESVKIKRKFPNEIQITIEERFPKLMITYGNAYVYIDSQGYMLEVSKEFQSLPILKGIRTPEEQIEAGNRLCEEDLEKLGTVLKIMEVAKSEEILDLISAIDIEDSNDYKLTMEVEKKTIYLGDCSSLDVRMLWVKGMLQKEKGIPGEIIVNMDLNTTIPPLFRERV